MVPRCFEALLHNVALLGSTVRQPAAKRQDGDLETRRTKVPEHHLRHLISKFSSYPRQLNH